MKRFAVSLLAAGMLVGSASAAQALIIERDGADYNGYANPGGCEIFVHTDRKVTDLHVDCSDSDQAARIRYRYLRELDVRKGPGEFTAVVKKNGGEGTVSDIRYMATPDSPRTGRVVIPAGLYVHIISVRADIENQ